MMSARVGHLCVSLRQARELAAWHWYTDQRTRPVTSSSGGRPETSLAYLPHIYRRAESDRKHRAAMVPLCEQLVQSQLTLSEALGNVMRIVRDVLDYGSQYFEAMVGATH